MDKPLSIPRTVTDALRPGETIEWIGKPARIQREAIFFGWAIALILAAVFWINPENADTPMALGLGIPAGILAFIYIGGAMITRSARFVITTEQVMVYGPGGDEGFHRLTITPETYCERRGSGRIGTLKIKNLAAPTFAPVTDWQEGLVAVVTPIFKVMDKISAKLPLTRRIGEPTFFEVKGPETPETILRAITAQKRAAQ